MNASLIFPESPIQGRDFVLEYEVQPNMRAPGTLRLEIRTNRTGGWREVKRYTEFRPFFLERISLRPHIPEGSTSLRVRFRMVAAGSEWWGSCIDSILLEAQ